ncbi:unnamed protein product [Amoebophrya sp. A120]|nr:unnamed protein product [Amoebophrya sp. A120]|eukprot:GSA120T00018536001.1
MPGTATTTELLFYPEEDEKSEKDRKVGFWEIASIASFNFPFGALCGPMGVAILPLEAERLAPESSSIMLGFMMGIVGVTQLVCPLAGILSDMHRSKMGKRRPFVFGGGIVTVVSLAGMWFCSLEKMKYEFIICLVASMTGLNVAYTASYGLVPDLIPTKDQGMASGIVGGLQLFGSLTGFIFLIVTYSYDYHINYLLYAIYLVMSLLLIAVVAQEEDTSNLIRPPFSWRQVLSSYTIDCSESYDFLWVFVGRTFYYVGISCQSFVLFFVRDVINVEEVSAQKYHVGAMALLAQLVGGVVAVHAGKLSDNKYFGRKRLVYAACTIMACVYVLWMATPWIFRNEIRFYLNHLDFDQYFKKFLPKRARQYLTQDYVYGSSGSAEDASGPLEGSMAHASMSYKNYNAAAVDGGGEDDVIGLGRTENGGEDGKAASSSSRERRRDLAAKTSAKNNESRPRNEWLGQGEKLLRPYDKDASSVVEKQGPIASFWSDVAASFSTGNARKNSSRRKRRKLDVEKTTEKETRDKESSPEEAQEESEFSALNMAPTSYRNTLPAASGAAAAALAEASVDSSNTNTAPTDPETTTVSTTVQDDVEDSPEWGVFNLPGNSRTTQGMELMFLYGCMAVYGVGNGAYLAVDLALALDCLPDPETSAQSLGIWGVSAFLGLAIGPLLWGSALELSGGETIGDVRVYPYTGYAYMLLGGCVFCFLSGAVVRKIKKST